MAERDANNFVTRLLRDEVEVPRTVAATRRKPNKGRDSGTLGIMRKAQTHTIGCPSAPGSGVCDARHDRYAEREWFAADEKPAGPMWTTVKASHEPTAVERRVLFSGRYWLTTDEVAAWKPLPRGEEMVGQLLETARGPSAINGLEVLELEGLPAGDERFVLAELARMELEVEVVRLFQPGEQASGTSSGRILAASANYAAQAVGDDAVMILEQQRLDRRLHPGENVTLDFTSGRGKVYAGLLFDVNVRAPFLSRDQAGWLRKLMIDALSQVEGAPQQDHLIKEALRYALTETIRTYSLDRSKITLAQITLSVKDAVSAAQLRALRAADEKRDRDGPLTLLPGPGREGRAW